MAIATNVTNATNVTSDYGSDDDYAGAGAGAGDAWTFAGVRRCQGLRRFMG